MEIWGIVENRKPLQRLEVADPVPQGHEVVIDVTHCGVCHSDLHFWDGEYDMGGGQVMRLTDRGVTLPRAPGHEVVGRVSAIGPEVRGVAVGDRRIVYPWIGCGDCAMCRAGDDNLCSKQSSVGVVRHGGFGARVLVPHERYLVDPGDLDPGVAATYACSGITVLAAIRKLGIRDPDQPVLLIGGGGLGQSAIAMLKALGHRAMIVADVKADQRALALGAGASAAIDPAAGDLAQQAQQIAGGPLLYVMDFVNSSQTARAGLDCLGKGGNLVLIGIAGGDLQISLTALVFGAKSVMSSQTGSIRDLEEVVALARSGKLPPIPTERMAADRANEALGRLERGEVKGRIILERSEP